MERNIVARKMDMPITGKNKLMLLLLFMLAFGIFNPIYGTIGICLLLCLIMTLFSYRKIWIPANFSFLWLFLFGIAYVLFGQLTVSYFVYYIVAVLLAFLSGCYCSGSIHGDSIHTTKMCVYIIVIAEACHALLNTIVNVGTVRWELIDYFRGLRVATASAFINTIILSFSFVFIFIEKNKKAKIIGLTSLAISAVYSFVLGTRTTYLVVAIVFVVNLFLYNHEQKSIKRYSKLACELLLIIVVGSIIYSVDAFGVRTVMEKSNLFVRFTEIDLDKSDQFRISNYSLGLTSLLEHPFGGQIEHRYFHNMWLDAGRVGGVFPFIFLLLYSISTLVHAIRLFMNRGIDCVYRYMILSIYIGMTLNFFTEPVLEGIMDSFLVFVFVTGLIDADYMSISYKL